jgi:S1-C subfamily serine protease
MTKRMIPGWIALYGMLGLALVPPILAGAQSRPVIDVTPPAAGETDTASALASTSLAENPLPELLSFSALGELMRGFATQNGVAMRGAKEIAVFRQAGPAVVLIKTKEGSGSGVILSNGRILTNRHVVEGIGVVQIFFKPVDIANGKQTTEMTSGKVQYVDVKRDLAIIKPDTLPADFKSLRIASRDDLDVGADVFAIGHPLGYTWTFTQGIVSGLRHIKRDDEDYTAIQTQTPINPGNSGGPLLDANVEIVGINTWARDIADIEERQLAGEKTTLTRPAQGLNFAVSAQDLRSFLSEVDRGKVVNLALELPELPGCSGKLLFNGRAKSDDAALRIYSMKCDDTPDAWYIRSDDKSKPGKLLLDPERSGKVSVIVLTDVKTGKWKTSYWDFFRDQTFAILGHHDNGKVKPDRFEFSRS